MHRSSLVPIPTLLCIGLVVLSLLTPVQAQTQNQSGVVDITFAQLEKPAMVLFSPIDQRSLDITLPYRWVMVGSQNYVELRYAMTYDGYNPTQPEESVNLNAQVDVYINSQLITNFTPQLGDASALRLSIPTNLLNNAESNRHRIRFVFKTENCESPRQTRFTIQPESWLHLEYQARPLDLSLANFPRPLVQDLFTPETILIIVPDDYNNADLSTVASIAATLGSRVNRVTTTMQLVTAGQATRELLFNKNAIIVGPPGRNAFLKNLYDQGLLPTTLSLDTFAIVANADLTIMPEDGVLQLIASDVNPDYAYLIVTANSDVGIYRAARALAMREPRYGLSGSLGVIEALSDLTVATTQISDVVTLDTLGYFDAPFYGMGTQSNSVNFTIPLNWQFTRNPVLTLRYLRSSALNPQVSVLNIMLNGGPVGSAPLDRTEQGELEVQIELPKQEFEPGHVNYLTFEGVVKPTSECALPPENAIWMRVLGSSELYLPHVETEQLLIPTDDIRTLFTSRPDLGNVWFSLSENPMPEELTGMLRTAWTLGKTSTGQGFAPIASRGIITDTQFLASFSIAPLTNTTSTPLPTSTQASDSISVTALLSAYHGIAFGLPASNPLLATLNAQLPQSFLLPENSLSQQIGNVIYRLPRNTNLGVVEVLYAPWNSGRALAVVTGTTPEGLGWAIDVLNNEELVTKLTGDVNFVIGERIEAVKSADFFEVPLRDAVEKVSGEAMLQEFIAPTAPPETVEAADVIPTIPRSPAELYEPQETERTGTVNFLILGLIGVGLLIGISGTLITWLTTHKVWSPSFTWLTTRKATLPSLTRIIVRKYRSRSRMDVQNNENPKDT